VQLKPDHTGQSENLFAQLRHAVLDGPGSTPPRVRHAVAYASREELAEELREYVMTLREHAYRVTDSQVADLLTAGWSEDQVYELTVAVALGAGQRRRDAGLAALARYGEPEPVDADSPAGPADVPPQAHPGWVPESRQPAGGPRPDYESDDRPLPQRSGRPLSHGTR
jgi:hypothetical protein